eukprot:7306957-Alexandrium_andersonii.AAC.1
MAGHRSSRPPGQRPLLRRGNRRARRQVRLGQIGALLLPRRGLGSRRLGGRDRSALLHRRLPPPHGRRLLARGRLSRLGGY